MQHLEEGTIHAWLDGALPPDEAARVEAHAASCAECAALVAEARGLVAGSSRIVSALDVVPANVIPMSRPAAPGSSSLWRKLGLTPSRAAIAALLLVGVASMFSVRHQPRGVPMGTVLQDPPAAPAVIEARPEKSAVNQPRKSVDTVAAKIAAEPTPTMSAPTGASPAAPAMAPPPVAAEPAQTELRAESAFVMAKARTDSSEARDRVNADAAVPSMRRMYTNSASGAAAAAMRNVSLEGCYSIPDSVRRQTPRLPSGYALEKDSLGFNIVRALTTLNRPDSIVTGATWRALPPTSVIVQPRLNAGPPAIVLGASRRIDCRP